MPEPAIKTRDDVTHGKVQTSWRISKLVLNALRADADQWGISVPILVNSMLTLHYFGDKISQGDR